MLSAPRRGCPPELKLQMLEAATWVLGTDLGSLQEQPGLLTTERSNPKNVSLIFIPTQQSSCKKEGRERKKEESWEKVYMGTQETSWLIFCRSQRKDKFDRGREPC